MNGSVNTQSRVVLSEQVLQIIYINIFFTVYVTFQTVATYLECTSYFYSLVVQYPG